MTEIEKAKRIYEYLYDRRKVLDFGRHLEDHGVYESPFSYRNFMLRLHSDSKLQYGMLFKIQRINELFENWLENNPIEIKYSEVIYG